MYKQCNHHRQCDPKWAAHESLEDPPRHTPPAQSYWSAPYRRNRSSASWFWARSRILGVGGLRFSSSSPRLCRGDWEWSDVPSKPHLPINKRQQVHSAKQQMLAPTHNPNDRCNPGLEGGGVVKNWKVVVVGNNGSEGEHSFTTSETALFTASSTCSWSLQPSHTPRFTMVTSWPATAPPRNSAQAETPIADDVAFDTWERNGFTKPAFHQLRGFSKTFLELECKIPLDRF